MLQMWGRDRGPGQDDKNRMHQALPSFARSTGWGDGQSGEEDREVPGVSYLRGLALTFPSLGRTESWKPLIAPGAGKHTKFLPPPRPLPACLCSED